MSSDFERVEDDQVEDVEDSSSIAGEGEESIMSDEEDEYGSDLIDGELLHVRCSLFFLLLLVIL